MVWYSHLFQKFPQFAVIHTVKGFGIVNKEEIDVFLELSCFFCDPMDVDSKYDFAPLPSCWGFFALGCGVYYFDGIQHSPFIGCSAASCNFGVFTGEGR